MNFHIILDVKCPQSRSPNRNFNNYTHWLRLQFSPKKIPSYDHSNSNFIACQLQCLVSASHNFLPVPWCSIHFPSISPYFPSSWSCFFPGPQGPPGATMATPRQVDAEITTGEAKQCILEQVEKESEADFATSFLVGQCQLNMFFSIRV